MQARKRGALRPAQFIFLRRAEGMFICLKTLKETEVKKWSVTSKVKISKTQYEL